MNRNCLIFNIDEVWLKGANRQHYIRALFSHIKAVCRQLFGECQFEQVNHCLLVSSENFDPQKYNRLKSICGVHSFDECWELPVDLDAVEAKIAEHFEREGIPESFKVESKRSDKRYPLNSMELNREFGGRILKRFDGQTRVDVKKPKRFIKLQILHHSILLKLKKHVAIGGLPVGMSGHALSLLSGGIDSPVASIFMSKRGLSLDFVFFHAYPFVGDEVLEKIKALFYKLSEFQRETSLYIIPFGDIQKKIAKACHEDYRTSFFRRYMIQAADLLATKIQAKALITGDSLGQVSSQTLENMALIEQATKLPLFRPLIGLNKKEVIKSAIDWGTYETSIIPHDDACARLAPAHPIIRPDIQYWETFDLDLRSDLEEAIAHCQRYTARS